MGKNMHESPITHPATHEELRQIHLFQSVDVATLEPLLSTCPLRVLSAGEVLITAREHNAYLYLLLSGRLSVHLETTESKPFVIFEPGESVGEISLLDGGPASAFVVAETVSRVLAVDKTTLWDLIEASNGVAKNLLSALCSRLRRNDRIMFADQQRLKRQVEELTRERKALRESEARLRQAQKMEAVGTLAGGIAHDFNNVLGAILGYTEMAVGVLPENNDRLRRYLEQVLAAGQRAKGVVNQILAFSRQGGAEPESVEVHALVTEVVQLLRASLPTTVEIRRHINSERCWIVADANQIHQIIMNLGTNAAQAMPAGGVMDIGLEPVQIDAPAAAAHPGLTPGRYVRLVVSDTGCGMDKATIERIFDPFFTTKGVGEGTGLGLSQVHGIVKDHGGAVEVESVPGRGTTFFVYLPLSDVSDADESTVSKEIRRGNGEMILLVDDEPSLVELGEEMLAALGYEPIGYDSSAEALAVFRANPNRYDLIITDQTMPGMTGSDLAVELTRIRPDVPIVLVTGQIEAGDADQVRRQGVYAILRKPLASSELAATITRALATGEDYGNS
jgi:signal transduction histidine kinase/ActR/RegA family two-component response regulator